MAPSIKGTQTPIACWRAVPLVTIVNACGIVFVCLFAFFERAPVIAAADAFGFNITQWTNIVIAACGTIFLIDGLIVVYAMAVSNYCLNHHCCQCLIEKPKELVNNAHGNCCDNCCASFLGDWVQRFLFLAAWVLGVMFTIAISGLSIAHLLLIHVDGACIDDNWESLTKHYETVLVNAIPKMGKNFYTEDSLKVFLKDPAGGCDIVKKGVGPATTMWMLVMVMSILQWNLVLTAYANFVRVDSTEKAKLHIANKLSNSMKDSHHKGSLGHGHHSTPILKNGMSGSIVINLPDSALGGRGYHTGSEKQKRRKVSDAVYGKGPAVRAPPGRARQTSKGREGNAV